MRVLLFLVVAFLGMKSPAGAKDVDLNLPPEELRASLIALLENYSLNPSHWEDWIRNGGESDPREMVGNLLRQYRFYPHVGSFEQLDAPAAFSIAHSPAADFVLHLEFAPIWNYVSGLPDLNPNYEQMLDYFIKGVIAKKIPAPGLPEALNEKASSLGVNVARKIARGKGPNCPLDLTDKLPGGGIPLLSDAWTGIRWLIEKTIWENFSDCSLRRLAYQEAKEILIKYRRTPELWKPIRDVLFVLGVSDIRSKVPGIIAEKFEGRYFGGLWNAPLVQNLVPADRIWPEESLQGDDRIITLKGFAQGLRADLRAAALFMREGSRRSRGLAAPLFFAAANRLLVFMGGRRMAWNGAYALNEKGNVFDAKDPLRAPVLRCQRFGGFGFGLVSNDPLPRDPCDSEKAQKGPHGYLPFDLANYSPLKNDHALVIIPSSFRLGGSWRPERREGDPAPFEDLEGMSELLLAVVDFLKSSQPGAVFEPLYGDRTNPKKFLDPKVMQLFPQMGRMLGVGVLATVMKNMAGSLLEDGPSSRNSPVGHLRRAPLGLNYVDRVTLPGMDGFLQEQEVSTRGAARLLTAALEMIKTLRNDPEIPDTFKNKEKEFLTAVWWALHQFLARGADSDKGFRLAFRTPRSDEPVVSKDLYTQVLGIAPVLEFYQLRSIAIFSDVIKKVWIYMDGFWDGEKLPRARIRFKERVKRPSELFALLNLWDRYHQTLQNLPIGSKEEQKILHWQTWESRFETIRRHLSQEMDPRFMPE